MINYTRKGTCPCRAYSSPSQLSISSDPFLCSSVSDSDRGDGDSDSGDCDDVYMYAGPLLKADKYDVGIPIKFQLELTNNSGQLIIHVLSHYTKKRTAYSTLSCMLAISL